MHEWNFRMFEQNIQPLEWNLQNIYLEFVINRIFESQDANSNEFYKLVTPWLFEVHLSVFDYS